MRIPGSQRTETIPGGANVAPISPTAAAAPYQALAGMGEAVSGFGEVLLKRQQKMQEERDFWDGQRAANQFTDESLGEFSKRHSKVGIEARGATEEHQIYFDKRVDEIAQTLTPTAADYFKKRSQGVRDRQLWNLSNKEAAEEDNYKDSVLAGVIVKFQEEIAQNPKRYNQFLANAYQVIDSRYPGLDNSKTKAMVAKNYRATQLESFINSDPQFAKQYIEANRDTIDPGQYQEFLPKAKAIEKLKAITAAKNYIIANPEGGSEALKASPVWDKVPDEDKPGLIHSADAAKKAFKTELKIKEKEGIKAQKDADDEIIYSEIRKGNLSRASAMVDNSSLGPHEKNSWHANLRERQRELKADKNPTEITDPLTYATVATMIYNNPQGISRAEIFQKIGKGENGGLSTVHAEHFANVLKTQMDALKEKKQPKDGVRSKEIASGLSILKTNHGYGVFGKDVEGDIKYQKTVEEFLQWSDANPDKDPSKKLEQILIPIKEEHTKSLIGRAWDYFWDKKPIAPKEETVNKRQRAIDILTKAGKLVNEETIKKVMDQLK